MNVKPVNKRFKPYTSSITVTEMLIDIDIDGDPAEIVLHHYPESKDDPNRDVIMTISRWELISEMLELYGEWSFVYNSTSSPSSVYNYTSPLFPRQVYLKLWGDYVKYNKDNWERIATAYSAKYDPISNYDRHENLNYEDTLTKKGSITHSNDNYQYSTNKGAITNSYGKIADVTVEIEEPSRGTDGTITTGTGSTATITASTDVAGVTTTNKSTTYDSDSPVETNSTTTEGVQQTVPNTVGYAKTLTDDKTSYSADYEEKTAHKDTGSRIYGNIGVTTSASMVREIDEVYRVNFLHKIVDEFAHRYLVYLPVDEDLENAEMNENDCYIV